MPAADYEANGFGYYGQIKVTRKPIHGKEVIRLMDLLDYLSQIASAPTAGIPDDDLFGGIDQSQANNGYAIYVQSNGKPKDATAAIGAERACFIKQHNKYFPAGKIIKRFSTGLTVGLPYFISTNGILSTIAPTSQGEWSIVAGIAINSTDLLVKLENQGQL